MHTNSPIVSDEQACDKTWVHTHIVSKEFPERSVEDIESVELVDFNGAGGLSGAEMRRLVITFVGGETLPVVFKKITERTITNSKNLGLAREGFLYERFCDTLAKSGVSVPKVYYSFGGMDTGDKQVFLEDLSSYVQSGYFYGPYSPLNWGKDLPSLIKGHVAESSTTLDSIKRISAHAFECAANLHGLYWMDESLGELPWLRGRSWVRAEDQASWDISQNSGRGFWTSVKNKIENSDHGVKWDPFMLECIEASFAKATWNDYLAENRAWTLVHGDFHPANMMWKSNADHSDGSLKILDWEMVGLGNGPQDLAQFMISHVCPEDRRACEMDLLRGYYDHLMTFERVSRTGYTWEQCLKDYRDGGVGRWMWLLALLADMCPAPMTQYFHDQVLAFIRDHELTVETIPMSRV